MIGVGLVAFSCVMFIHLGLGDAISKIIHLDFVLLKCVKCLTFWSVLSYAYLFINQPLVESVSVAFCASYASLWADLILAKMANKYDIWYKKIQEDLEREEIQEDGRAERNDKDSSEEER